jgi:acyl-CoA thioesterase FadM
MVLVHHRETAFGEALTARTWVSTFRRGTLSDRQVRILGTAGLVASATQRWVHVALPDLKPVRAAPDLERSFGVTALDGDGDVVLPAFDPDPGSEHAWTFTAWYTWMDPLAHANHPAYVDWADEAACRLAAGAGLDPHALRPIAEGVTWRSGVVAPQTVTLRTRRAGRTAAGAVVLEHRFEAEGRLCAEATTVRAWSDDPDRFHAAVG